jgi:omega-6 fatty acid desaturase (delta-12 desaturase)
VPRVPNYRLEACHNAHPAFGTAHVLGLREGMRASRYALWDEAEGRMVTFAEADDRDASAVTIVGSAII